MLCTKPFRKDGLEFGCGQCLACRINRARLWTGRIVLESFCHESNCFVTLTYDDEHLPLNGSLVKEHPQLFLKRLRKRVSPQLIRFYLCGEYGEKTQRPHYHMIIFGIGPEYEAIIQECWDHGFVHCGTVDHRSAAYVAGYVHKGLKANHPDLRGRYPEYSRMSLRPAIGKRGTDNICEAHSMTDEDEPPRVFRVGGTDYPLGRYLSNYVRTIFGYESPKERHKANTYITQFKRIEELGSVAKFVDEQQSKRTASDHRSQARQRFNRTLRTL